ncbi:zinc finger protein 711-like isoform X2 [Diabrotica undecimpunctata]|uniref:zinc finger protein 711-like isoform X2 n=1 Tax=Diabrotica undecimpunctata TaxID=50387 RepID=UPI003B6328D5
MEDDMDDIFDEEVEKSKELKAVLPIKQETQFYPEDTGLFTNISHTNENIDIKSENFYEEFNDNFELKLEELDVLKIEAEDIKQLCNKSIKSPKKKIYICVMCQKRFPSASRRNNHLSIHFDVPVKTKNGKSSSSSGFFGTQIFICGFCGQFHLNKKQILNHCQQYYIKTRRHIGYNGKYTNSALGYIDVFKSEVKLETEGDNRVNNMHLVGSRLSSSKISNKPNKKFNKIFPCKRCNCKIFSTKTDLAQHLQNHDKYKCEICAKEYVVKRTFQLHMLSHKEDTKDNQNSKPYVICYICSKFFANEQALRYHLVSHTGERKYSCNHCSKRYRYEQDLKRHNMDSHMGRDIKLFECCHCHKGFKHKGHLNRHLEGHFTQGSKNYKCDKCPNSYQRRESLHLHLRICHNNENLTQSLIKLRQKRLKKIVECEYCGKKYIRNNCLLRHIKQFHESQRYICYLCDRSYKRKDDLKEHIAKCRRKKTVKNQDSSECKQCGTIFQHHGNLQRHVEHVHERQRYICYLCNKSYSRKDDLITHFEVHK